VLEKCGCALIGQTEEIAPADKKIYALRDVTGTVDNPFLICASIMSKKLAEGIDALVLDVKTGSGAFMKKIEDAEYLAGLMVETGKRMGKKMVALITDMDQPLGRTAGNAMEIAECVEVLGGGGPADLRELSIELSGWMFFLGERTKDVAEGRKLAEEMIASGRARDKFRDIIREQGGDARIVDEPQRLPQARGKLDVVSAAAGFVAGIECERLGIACGVLGGGREKKEDAIDPAVGLEFHSRLGERVERGSKLATLHYNSNARLDEARKLVEASYRIGPEPPAPRPLVHKVIGG
jgi:pyrimidine-nucleoside phosphorylase